MFGNRMHADARGLELSADWQPVPFWRLEAGYAALDLTPHLDADSRDPGTAVYDGSAPRQQWQARSWIALPPNIQVDVLILHAGAISGIKVPGVHACRPSRRICRYTADITGGGGGETADASHVEFAGVGVQVLATRQPRAGRVQLVWKF